jgi:ankyrin repeat protein
VLHSAVNTGNLEKLQALCSWAKEAQLIPNELSKLLLSKNKFGNTGWHIAVKRGNLEVLETLWSWAKEAQLKPNDLRKLLLVKDENGNTVTCCSKQRQFRDVRGIMELG